MDVKPRNTATDYGAWLLPIQKRKQKARSSKQSTEIQELILNSNSSWAAANSNRNEIETDSEPELSMGETNKEITCFTIRRPHPSTSLMRRKPSASNGNHSLNKFQQIASNPLRIHVRGLSAKSVPHTTQEHSKQPKPSKTGKSKQKRVKVSKSKKWTQLEFNSMMPWITQRMWNTIGCLALRPPRSLLPRAEGTAGEHISLFEPGNR